MSKRPAVFLDRDGTLNHECGYITRPDQLRILPGAAGSLRDLHEAGFACVVVTNQSAVGRGLMTERDLDCIHDELMRQLRVHDAILDGIYFCRAASANDPERKPAPGMLHRAARELNLDLPRSWMIGDSLRDMQAGHRAGCHGCILVRTGHDVSYAISRLREGDMIVENLAEAAGVILGRAVNPQAGWSRDRAPEA